MWWHADASGVHRIGDRVSTVYVERCHVDRDENAVVFINKDRTVRLPAALIGSVLMGPGTRVTHGAMSLLGDSGTAVAWVGEHGVRMYAAALGPARSSHVIQRQAQLVSDDALRLGVARAMFLMRFPDVDTSGRSMQQLRGMEGARVKKLYRAHADRTGVAWKRREYKPGEAFAAGDDVNRVLSAANAALYGACHAAIVGVGASPALGFVHVGSAISFVLDVADLYKAEYTIPLAFDLAAEGRVDESDARWALRDRFAASGFMGRVVKDVLRLLLAGEAASEGTDLAGLWDEAAGVVTGGRNWSLDEEWFKENLDYAVLLGPDFGQAEVPF